jgi:1,4-dihydroxy-6-naphthoate synthase
MEKTKISLGFSPCPNDCFMFDALVHGKIDTKGLKFEAVMEDVESLNKKAFAGALDVTKLSYHAFAYLTNKYQLLASGSALGFNCGPLLIGLPATIDRAASDASLLNSMRVAIPGKYTTANFLLSLAYPQMKNKQEMVFSEIEGAVLNKKVDLGLIIHENRFTYQQKGLKKVVDLGEWWEKNTGNAIPLGGIVVKRDLPQEQKLLINDLVKQSVEYAFANPADVMPFVKRHAQEMDEGVMKQHIELYVNKYSIDLGATGRKAVNDLFEKAAKEKIIETVPPDIFVN